MALNNTDDRTVPGSPAGLTFWLWVMAVVSVALGLAAGITMMIVAADQAGVTTVTVLWSLMVLAGSCCVALVLAALGWLCRSHYYQVLASRRLPTEAQPPGTPVADKSLSNSGEEAESTAQAGTLETVLEQLRELNVNVLLSESQRKVKRQYLLEQQAQEVASTVEHSAATGDVALAEQRLERLVQLVPDWPRIEQLRQRVRQVRAEAEAKDVAEASGRTEALISMGNLDEAEAVADALLARRPSSAPAIGLLDRVRRERQALADAHRIGLYHKLDKEVLMRHWRAALVSAREFIEAFPESAEAQTVRTQMDTIAENARIEEVRELRDRIRNLIDRQQFAEAVELAQEVVARHPGTAAAAELKQQMSRLEERARIEKGASA